ncbi:fimbrial protein [Photorhabdus sp. RM323S]|uniref:fimbrial protein n=1 Tax=Photorhabdus sp. RM323S TaxID=3342828 RepID=UPI0036DA7715
MKKQIMKTSVLAAVLLSMGMAHATGGAVTGETVEGNTILLNVNAVITAPTCSFSLDSDGANITNNGRLGLGSHSFSDVPSSINLEEAKDLTVTLADCNGKTAQLAIGGTNPNNEKAKFIGQTGDTVAVQVFDGSVAMSTDAPISISVPTDAKTTIKKTLKVGLIKAGSAAVGAGSVLVPLTFNLTYQ